MAESDSRSDERLVEAYRDGESSAFAVLVERYHDDLIRFLVRLMGSRAAAEDAFQEAFLQVHASAETFDTSRRFKPWLFTIAANKGRDALRKSTRRKALDLSAPVRGGGDGDRTYVDLLEIDVPPPGSGVEAREQGAMVQRAIDEMPHALREILLLAYFQRMSYAQIAESLEIPLGTVKSRLHSAVASFASKWRRVSAGQGESRKADVDDT